MKSLVTSIIILAFFQSTVNCQPPAANYTGSTPANAEVRSFLGISMTDSIDFVRWKLSLNGDAYEVNCEYGLSKPSTNGFTKDQTVMIKSMLVRQAPFIQLQNNGKSIYLLVVNSNLLHFANANKQLLTGNGGWSYVLNNIKPTASNQFNFPYTIAPPATAMAFHGRTPCKPLADMLELGKGPQCYKMKWHVVLYTDSLTGEPTYFTKGSRREREDPNLRGKWAIRKGKQGETIYVLNPEKGDAATHLLKAADNILFITDAKGNLLVGDHDFSYTLNELK
jgi:hypothetical protein